VTLHDCKFAHSSDRRHYYKERMGMYDFFIDPYGTISLLSGQGGEIQAHYDRRICSWLPCSPAGLNFGRLCCAMLAENKLMRGCRIGGSPTSPPPPRPLGDWQGLHQGFSIQLWRFLFYLGFLPKSSLDIKLW